MKIAVLYGGISGEREVSLSSGKGIINALKQKGHDVIGIDFHPDHLEEIFNLQVDLVFIGLHGKFGEDGKLQGLLDMLHIPYVGSGVLASALAMDKAKAKQIFEMSHIPVAESKTYYVNDETEVQAIVEDINHTFETPFVVKPNQEGSTLGLSIIKDKKEVSNAVKKALNSDRKVLVEKFVRGRELTVPVIGPTGAEKALPIIEIIPKNEFYDYESKYAPGGSEHVVPAPINETLTKQIQEYAVLAHQVLGCKTYSRVDFILSEENIPVILEVNTLPGMTPTSLFPDSAKAVGISYEDMIERFVQLSK
ncbi:D-alanine--D-alanine ligase [Oceanobacillus bengalensis]|uniref:D-alanine--D-alanine ligase n=1 Tax=Oceanobacillus bengalensis TaxID=1435466 RepID=A0A494Z0U9_9BACI|nr:D-alanine--D-alanine ligase [Oceanobacillus bengalensis]RKQ16122.1 D-alanine--D-alanine ligase [Oceanobacillus bengalensis]